MPRGKTRTITIALLLLSAAAAPIAEAQAQQTQTTLSPAYRRARLRSLLDEWEARLPIVKRQVEVAQQKLDELGPQIDPAKAEAETARRQTLAVRQRLREVTDQVVAEIGAAGGLLEAERARDAAIANRDALRTRLLTGAGDDPGRAARRAAIAEAQAKLETVKADAGATQEQRLAAVSAVTAAEAELAAHDAATLARSDAYQRAAKEADDAAARATAIRAAALREADKDERVKTAERTLHDAQRFTTEAARRAGALDAQHRTYRSRFAAASAELAQLEASIDGARRELGVGVLSDD